MSQDNSVQEKKEMYKLGFDGDEKNVMIIEIPLKEIAMSSNAIDSQVYLRGFFEEAKEQALFHVNIRRRQQKQTGVIVPRTMQKTNLEVH